MIGNLEMVALVAGEHRAIVRELADPARFRDFRVAMDTVIWENGFDLAPEYLRELLPPRG